MATTIRVNLQPVTTILANRGIERGGRASLFMTSEIHRLSMPYIPFDNNPLSTTVDIQANSITYKMPYANYQWRGISKNGRSLKYQGAPKRGKEWTNRAMADHKQEVANSVERFIKEGR